MAIAAVFSQNRGGAEAVRWISDPVSHMLNRPSKYSSANASIKREMSAVQI